MKVLERVLQKRIMCQLVTCSLASCLERGPLMPFSSCDKYKRHQAKKNKLYYVFVDLLLYALFNHPRLLIQVARVQKDQFSYRLDGLVP